MTCWGLWTKSQLHIFIIIEVTGFYKHAIKKGLTPMNVWATRALCEATYLADLCVCVGG